MSNTQPTTPQQPCPACASSCHTRGTVNAGCICGQTHESNSPPETSGDQGGTALLADKHRSKGDLVLIRRAMRNKWPVKTGDQAVIVDRLMRLVDDPDPKVAVSAVRTGVAMVDANIRIDMEDDKADRLDAGAATERVEMPVKFIRGTEGEGV